ncbi:MAG: glycosyltransferase family A protein [Clostridia bacterium]|nr:glycosyltransferase family A protein [Clostridia bacterium]
MNKKLEILVSCMFSDSKKLVSDSHITGDCVIINQCDEDTAYSFATENGTASVYCVTERGLTRSRNMAIEKSTAEICLLCDDDEIFASDYSEKIIRAYEENPGADVIVFKMIGIKPSFSDRVQELKFPKIMRVASWQISFRKQSLIKTGVRFDELMGSGTGNGAEEEFRFLTDCIKSGLKIIYVPYEIAEVSKMGEGESKWFQGFDEMFFENRGSTTRYIMGLPLASAYAFYYCLKKKKMYSSDISMFNALKSTLRGIRKNKLGKLRSLCEDSDTERG